MGGIREHKYIYVKNFFVKEELDFLQLYCKKRIFFGKDSYLMDGQCPFNASFYDDMVMSTLLESKKNKVEEVSKLKLFPTYTYWRGYVFNATLEDHKDRESCEISVTANIDKCGEPWPIHMDGNWMEIETGDALIYLGCELNHGRKLFNGLYHAQVFFHYVDQNGPFANHKFDNIVKEEVYGTKNK